MAENDISAPAGGATFTAGETKLLMTILQHLKGDLAANWDTVATAMGYKDASIAKTRWSQIRKKKIGGATANAGVTKHRAPNKKTTTKKAVSDNEDDEDSKPIKPATKGKGKGKAVKSATKIKDEDENNGDATEAWVAAQADQAEPGDEFGALPTADSQA